jgi:membrane protease YdiL (CAAX protease family)
LSAAISQSQSFSQIVDQGLILQIVGYAIAAVVAFALVTKQQGGDWTSLGIARPADPMGEVLKGAGFGLLLLAAWMPIGFMLGGRRFELDRLMQILVGETSGIGLLLAGVVLVVGAPVIEEIYYRGMLYEKLARRSTWLAIILSSVLFVAAHGSLVILPLYVLAFGVAWKRRTKTLWFTMAAHGAWNFAVLCLAALIIFSPAESFSPPDGSYSIAHPASWRRVREAERELPTGGGIDLALETGSGSAVVLKRAPVSPGTSVEDVPMLLDRVYRSGTLPVDSMEIPQPVAVNSGGPLDGAWQMRGSMTAPSGVEIRTRVIVALPRGWEQAVTIVFVCPLPACPSAEPEFNSILGSFQPNL